MMFVFADIHEYIMFFHLIVSQNYPDWVSSIYIYIHTFFSYFFPRVQFLSTVSKFGSTESSGRNMFSKGWCLLVPIGWDGSVYILCLHLFAVLYNGSHDNI